MDEPKKAAPPKMNDYTKVALALGRRTLREKINLTRAGMLALKLDKALYDSVGKVVTAAPVCLEYYGMALHNNPETLLREIRAFLEEIAFAEVARDYVK